MGERVPQHVQNLVIRDYCQRNEFRYLLSATEYAMPDCHLIHEQVLNELVEVDGVVAYSLFQLPENDDYRRHIFENIIENKKSYHFAVEGLNLTNIHDCERIEQIWQIRKAIPHCLNNLHL